MEIDDFIKNIAGQLSSHDPSELTPQTKLTNIDGYSSLERLFIMMMVDEVYNVNLSEEDMKDSITIEELFDIVKSKM